MEMFGIQPVWVSVIGVLILVIFAMVFLVSALSDNGSGGGARLLDLFLTLVVVVLMFPVWGAEDANIRGTVVALLEDDQVQVSTSGNMYPFIADINGEWPEEIAVGDHVKISALAKEDGTFVTEGQRYPVKIYQVVEVRRVEGDTVRIWKRE